MAAPMYNVYVGAETGFLKGINTFKGFWDNLNEIKSPEKSKEIRCLSWVDDKETKLCVGLKNKTVSIYNQNNRSFSEPVVLDGGKGNLRNAFKLGDSDITALDTGIVNIWNDGESVTELKSGDHLQCLALDPFNKTCFGTGGKEADLKLWDINDTESPTFQAKNVRNDWLNLRVPVWIMGIGFLDDSKIVTCTGHHQIRVYDPKVQRRPVLDMAFDEYPLTAMSLYGDNQVVVGNTQGKMALLDIRKGKLVHIFKGFSGALRSIMCHRSRPVVASCGLDRFVRLHDINSREMFHKIYMKSRLNCVLLSNSWSDERETSKDVPDVGNKTKQQTSEDDWSDAADTSDNDDEDVWEKLEVVKTRTLKKSETVSEEEGESTTDNKRKGNLADKKDRKKKKKV